MKTVLIYDTGYGVEIAAGLARQGVKVKYYTPYQRPSPEIKTYAAGLGIPGIEKVFHFWDHIDTVDIVMFLDMGMGDAAAYLRKQGKIVFAAGHGEKLEQERWEFRKIQKKIGLPIQDTTLVTGTTELRKYLTANKDKYVKLAVFRGSSESFESKSIDKSDLIIQEVEAAFGPLREDYKFICESLVDSAIETGFDALYGKGWVTPTLWGYEFQKGAYIGEFGNVPKWHQKTMKALTPIMEQYDYRGPISVEERITGKDTSIAIDVTARFPFTFSSAYPDWITNFPEVIYKVARKESVAIKPKARFVGVLPLESPHTKDHYLHLNFDESLRTKGVKNGCVRLSMAFKVGKSYYAIPGMCVVYNLVAWGDSVDSVSDTLRSMVDKVDACDIVKDVSGLDKILKVRKQLGW